MASRLESDDDDRGSLHTKENMIVYEAANGDAMVASAGEATAAV